MAHTPGPWVAQVDPLGGNKRYGPRMALVATTAGDGSVCIDCTGSGKDFDESAANARLIASSPELLDLTNALLFVVRALATELGIDPETTEFRFTANGKPVADINLASVYARADAAIAKATS
jgi:hypothetical protein